MVLPGPFEHKYLRMLSSDGVGWKADLGIDGVRLQTDVDGERLQIDSGGGVRVQTDVGDVRRQIDAGGVQLQLDVGGVRLQNNVDDVRLLTGVEGLRLQMDACLLCDCMQISCFCFSSFAARCALIHAQDQCPVLPRELPD